MPVPTASPWALLLQVTQRLAQPFDLLSMLTEVTEAARALMKVDRASVWLLDDQRDELVLRVSMDADPVSLPRGFGLVGACAQSLQPVVVLDCYSDARFSPMVDRTTGYVTRQCLCLPLLGPHGALTGVLQCLNPESQSWTAAELALGEALAAQCAVAIWRVQAEADRRARLALEAQLATARAIQRASLPLERPALPGWDIFSHFQPAEATGGDTFDCRLVDGRLLLVVADAAGHGIGPALAVVQMQSMLRTALALGSSLQTALHHVNAQLLTQLPDGLFITAFAGLLDPQTGDLDWISAGQGPLLVARATGSPVSFEPLRAQMPPLGMTSWPEPPRPHQLRLNPGDAIWLFTDGVLEAANAGGAPFGLKGLEQAYAELGGVSLQTAGPHLLAALNRHCDGIGLADDVTLLGARRLPL